MSRAASWVAVSCLAAAVGAPPACGAAEDGVAGPGGAGGSAAFAGSDASAGNVGAAGLAATGGSAAAAGSLGTGGSAAAGTAGQDASAGAGAGGEGGVSGQAGTGAEGGADADLDATDGAPGDGPSDAPIDCGVLTNCSNQCVDTTSDAANCGGCGKACAAQERCCASVCVETLSCSFAVTSVSPAYGWQNGGDFVTIQGSGFAAGAKVYFDDGRAAAWVKDASTIVTQTPPHPVAHVAVEVVQGAATATLNQAFWYSSGSVSLPWQTKPLSAVRGENPGLAVMMDGRTIVTGGTTIPDNVGLSSNTAEIYDRVANSVTAAGNAMSTGRWQGSAVTLLTGKVLAVGGACYSNLTTCSGNPALADLFDPGTNLFAPTATPMNVGRAYTRSILLPDGRVLIASSNTGSVEIYDPVLDSFSQIAHAQTHVFGFIVRLRDGRVMLGGGDVSLGSGTGKVVEIYDADLGTFSPTGSLNTARSMLTAHTLPDGRVIVIGGSNVSAGGVNAPQSSMETWDPTTGVWTPTPMSLAVGRTWHASALIRDGTILVLGGYTITGSCQPTDTAEQVDPVASSVTPFGTLPNPNCEWNAVTMLDGSVLAVGGGACGASSALPDIDFLPAN